MVWNWFRRHPVLIHGALIVLLGAVYLANALHEHRDVAGVGLALLQTVPLLWRRSHPFAVLALVTAGAVASGIAYEQIIPLAPAVATYTVAAHETRRRSALAAAAALVPLAVAAVRAPDYVSLVFVAAAWVVGDNLRTRRAYLHELEEKTERLEGEREANIQRAAAEEQARISRELHDVIAHNVSVMTIQAAAARDVFEADPSRAREALGSIESTGRAALTELRRLLSAVRDGGPPELAPQPGLGAVGELVSQVRRSGLDVELSLEGDRPALPAALDLSAYRIVQEALTNTLKHASARRAWLEIRYGQSEVDVTVRDDGVGGPANGADSGGGRGLVGMRERVELFGGQLEAGPQAGGGYAVSARLPIGADE
jgi:signal transduction histidine kinase